MSSNPINDGPQWKEFHIEKEQNEKGDTISTVIGTLTIIDQKGEEKNFKIQLMFAGTLDASHEEEIKNRYGGKAEELIKSHRIGEKIQQITISTNFNSNQVKVDRILIPGKKDTTSWQTPEELKNKIQRSQDAIVDLIKGGREDSQVGGFAQERDADGLPTPKAIDTIRALVNDNSRGKELKTKVEKLEKAVQKYRSLIAIQTQGRALEPPQSRNDQPTLQIVAQKQGKGDYGSFPPDWKKRHVQDEEPNVKTFDLTHKNENEQAESIKSEPKAIPESPTAKERLAEKFKSQVLKKNEYGPLPGIPSNPPPTNTSSTVENTLSHQDRKRKLAEQIRGGNQPASSPPKEEGTGKPKLPPRPNIPPRTDEKKDRRE